MMQDATIRKLSGMPLSARRHALRAVWWQSHVLFKAETYGLTETLERSLRIPTRDARRLDREHVFHDWLQKLEWYCASVRNLQQLTQDERQVTTADPALFERLSTSGQTIILSPMHMGVYSMSVMHIAYRYFSGRRILILRAREDHETDNTAMRRLKQVAAEFRFLNVNARSEFADAMRFARGGALVICFIDLPSQYGSPANVTLFGKPARIALGIDAMARILDAIILPMAVQSSLDGDLVLNGTPFDVLDGSARERSSVASRVAREIERFVHHVPAQWHMWERLHEFTDPSVASSEELPNVMA